MIINAIDVIAFGNFKDIHAEFTSNLNIIHGNVENSKVALLDFITMLFYGSPPVDGKSDVITSERLKYRPTDSNLEMGGAIEFVFNDNEYRLHRIFRNSNATDTVTLYNLTTNLEEKIPNHKEVGKFLFGLNKQAFKRSAFINSTSMGLDDSTVAESLVNLIQTCEENVSSTKVLEELNSTKESYLSKSGKVGILDKNKITLRSLYEDIEVAKQEESKKIEMQMEYQSVQESCDDIVRRYDELKRQLDIQNMMEEVNALKTTVSKFDKVTELNQEIERRKALLTNENVTVDNAFINTAQQKMVALQQIGEHKNQMQSKVYKLKKEIETMKEGLENSYTEEHKLYDEAVEQIEFTLGHIKNIDDNIESKKKELTENMEKINNADVDFRVVDEQLKAQQELGKQRISMAQQQLDDAKQSMIMEVPESSAKSFIVLGVIIALLGIIMVLFAHNNLFFIMLCAGIFVALLSFVDRDKAVKKQNDYHRMDEVALSKATENMQNVRYEVEVAQQYLVKKQRETKKQLNIFKLNEEQIITDIEKLEEQKATLEKNLEYWKNQKIEMEGVFKSEQEKVDRKQTELENTLEDIANSEKSFSTAQTEVIKYVNMFKPCNSLNEVAKAIASLNNDLNEIKDLENKRDYQQETVKSETNGQTYETIKEKLTNVTEDFIEMCGKDNPEPMSISELSALKAELDECQYSLNMQNKDLTLINSDIRANFRKAVCVTQIEHNINTLERTINRQEKFCRSVDLALEVLEQSIEDMKVYTTKLCDRTSTIFKEITKNTSHENSAILQTLENFSQSDNSMEDWKYLADGTMEQASVSLKLGISELLCENLSIDALPTIFDDTFIQYNDDSVKDGINFLYEYSNHTQVIIFTAHQNVMDTIESNNMQVNSVAIEN